MCVQSSSVRSAHFCLNDPTNCVHRPFKMSLFMISPPALYSWTIETRNQNDDRGTPSCYRFHMGQNIPFLDRVKIAWRVLLHGDYTAELIEGLKALETVRAKANLPAERLHASGLLLLAGL